MAIDLTEGINQWVDFIPDYKQRIADGSIFDNRKQSPKDRISCQIRILNHAQRSNYLALIRSISNLSEINELTVEARRQIVTENTKDWKNLVADGVKVESGIDFYNSQTDAFVNLVEEILTGDLPLKPDELDKEGNVTKPGDEKNSEG